MRSILDLLVVIGIAVLAAGVSLSVVGDYAPDYVQSVVGLAGGPTGKFFPALTATAAAAQCLFFTGAAILAIPPLMRRSPVFSVLQVNAMLSTLVPMFALTFPVELATRLAITYASLLTLVWFQALSISFIWQVLWPPYIWRSIKGSNGPNPLAAMGTELLVWGYAFMSLNQTWAWWFLLAGSIVLSRFAWLGMKERVAMSRAWFALNGLVYAPGAVLKIAYLMAT
jgi:hypothetical protein